MTEPAQHVVNVPRHVSFRQMRSVDQDNRHSKFARGHKLCPRPVAAGILGDHIVDAMRAQQAQVTLGCEGATCQHELRLRQRQRGGGRINETQQVGVLPPGGKGCEGLFADRQEYAGRRIWQSRNGSLGIAHVLPVFAGFCDPWRALAGDERRSGPGAREDGMTAHLRRKRMRSVDHVSDPLSLEITDEAVDPAETADARRQRLRGGHRRATCIGEGCCDAGIGQLAGDPARLARAAEKEDVCHG